MSSKTKTTATKEEAKPALVPKLRFPEFREAEEWSEMTVGGISSTVIAGGTPSTSEKKFWGGDIRWMNSGELNDKRVSEVQGRITREGLNNSSTKIIPPRCVLIGLAGQGKTRGTVAMNLVELCTNQSIAAIFPNEPVFDSDFLYHDLDRQYDELRRLSAGGEGRGGLNLQIIKSLPVLLPSRAEQQKIAECLSSVDELLAAQARKVDALKTHKKGLMQQLFPREGETQPRLRFPEFQNAGAWEEQSIGDFGHVVSGRTPSTAQPKFYGGGLPFVSPADISDLRFVDQTKTTLTEEGFAETRPIKAGSVLFVCIGSTIGKVAQNVHDCATNQQINAVVPNSKHSGGFVYFALALASERIALLAGRQAVPIINKSLFSSVRILAPKLPEQQRIATCLSSLDALITAETQKLEALKTHKKGLMQQLFPSPDPQQLST